MKKSFVIHEGTYSTTEIESNLENLGMNTRYSLLYHYNDIKEKVRNVLVMVDLIQMTY